MKTILAVFAVCVCLFVADASACPVATVSQFNHCAVAVQAVPVQAYAVQAFAVPTVAYYQQPVVVQQNVVVKQRQRVIQQRQVIRSRTVIRN